MKWPSESAEPRYESKIQSAHGGRPRIRTESPLWAPLRGEFPYLPQDLAPSIATDEVPFLAARYDELDLSFDAAAATIWCFMRPKGPPSFTPSLLRELIAMRRSLQASFTNPAAVRPRYFVGGSRLPHIFNLGGDLAYFAETIRTGNRDALTRYAHDCVDVGYHMAIGFDLPVITIALVQGDALGGGFEGALSFNVLVAEKSAKFGLPEILFNMFPGMGAYSFLSRRLDAARAERMILSGRIYSASELHDMGLIDVLADDGCGEAAVKDHIARNNRVHAAHRSVRDVRHRINPLSLEELKDVADIWADHALQLEETDLRRMERLTAAQNRRVAAQPAAGL